MIQRKLTKHFIYNWLKEDLFGEFSLQKDPRTDKLSRKILKKVWKNINSYRTYRLAKRSLLKLRKVRNLKASLLKIRSRPKKLNFFIKRKPRRFNKAHFKNKNKRYFPLKTLKSSRYIFRKPTKQLSNKFFFRKKLALFYRKTWRKPIKKFRYFGYKLAHITGEVMKKKKKVFLELTFDTLVYKPKVYRVKKNEKRALKRFHLLQFFGLAHNPEKHYSIFFNSRKRPLTQISSLEFQLSNIITRAGFVESGHNAVHLVKRFFFSVNGAPVNVGHYRLHPWDVVQPHGKQIWWFVYSRFYHFLNILINSKRFIRYNRRSRKFFSFGHFHITYYKKYNYKSKMYNFYKKQSYKKTKGKLKKKFNNFFLDNHVHTGNFFYKRSIFYSVIKNKDFQEKLFRFKTRAHLLNPAPKYMEISYKLFLCVIFRNAVSSDLGLPYGFKNLKYLLKSKRRTLFL